MGIIFHNKHTCHAYRKVVFPLFYQPRSSSSMFDNDSDCFIYLFIYLSMHCSNPYRSFIASMIGHGLSTNITPCLSFRGGGHVVSEGLGSLKICLYVFLNSLILGKWVHLSLSSGRSHLISKYISFKIL